MKKIEMNLLKSNEFDDGKERYIGMWKTVEKGRLVGGHEAYYSNPKDLFNAVRESYGRANIQISVKSEELSDVLRDLYWYKDRVAIENSELIEIVKEQQNGGHKVGLIA